MRSRSCTIRVERGGHELVHLCRVVAFHEMRLVAVAAEQVLELFMADAGEHARVGDLVAVQMENRQNHTVGQRIQEFVGMPARGQRPRLRLTVADDAGDDQVRVVERRTKRMRERVAELAAFMNGARCLGCHVARNTAGERELFEQSLHPPFVQGDVRIHLAVRAIEPGIGHQAGPAVARPGDVDHAEVMLLDDAVQVRVDEVQPGCRAPVTEQARLDVLARERLLQQRIVIQVDLPDRQIVGSAPVGVHLVQQLRAQGFDGVFHASSPVVRRLDR